MTDKRFGSLQGLVMRNTRLDGCGAPVPGACGTAVSNGFVNVGVKANIDNGDTFQVKLADGTYFINQRSCPVLNWYDLDIQFANIDPEFFEPMSSALNVVTDVRGDAVGYQNGSDANCANFALEVWTRVAGNACGALACGPGAHERYIYWLFPLVTNGALGDYTISNGPLEIHLTASTLANPSWGQGPYNVVCLDDVDDGSCTLAGPLADSPVLTTTHLYKRLTSLAPPSTSLCGCQTLTPVDPVDLGSS